VEATAPAVFELGLVLLLAALAGWAARRFGLPAVVGYLAVGLIVSPFTPGYVADRHQLEVLADIGVVLLLFEVGIEIDPLRLRRERGRLLALAPLQVLIGTAAAAGAFLLAGLPVAGAILAGVCVALSSSVVVVNITRSKRRTTDLPTEETLLGWSVLQDLFGVLLAILLLLGFGFTGRSLPAAVGGLVAYLAIALAAAWAIPWLLRRLRGEHDLFLLISVASGLAVAGLGARVFGVPLALAAFVAGLAVSEGVDTAEARRRLLPFRDLFAVMFFVAIGTLIDPAALPSALPWILLLAGLLLAAKSLPIYALARFGRLPVRALQLTVGLSQIGEFSFVLASIGVASRVIPAALYTAFLAVVAASIAVSTVLVRAFPRRVEAAA
jgi:CPA2 family monovalent cation:H+ antiporter-2